jgi:hypothetical protein
MLTFLRKWMSRGRPTVATTGRGIQAPHLGGRLAGSPNTVVAAGLEPAVFHITHWKAGSQWIARILRDLVGDRLVLPVNSLQDQFLKWPIQPGMVYPAIYVSKEQFDQVSKPSNCRRFVIIRDLRDTLVSLYFSVKISHALPAQLASMRTALSQRDHEAGLLYTMENWLPGVAVIQESWLRAQEPLLHYEDLLENDLEILERLLLEQCQLRVTPAQLREVVLASRFECLTGGRQRGQEDITAHERKGISGDWRNYFTDRVTRAFKERFGKLLIATGYEEDLAWRAGPMTLPFPTTARLRRVA